MNYYCKESHDTFVLTDLKEIGVNIRSLPSRLSNSFKHGQRSLLKNFKKTDKLKLLESALTKIILKGKEMSLKSR
jgi:hypothetical protein